MRIFKWMKLDALTSRSVFRFFLIFMAISLFVGLCNRELPGGWIALYMTFGGMVVVSTPFSAQRGFHFMEMLPTKVYERVFGRFLAGAAFILLAAFCGLALDLAINGISVETAAPALALACFFAGLALFVVAVEFLLFYCFVIENAQIISLIRTIPGFIFFFGINGVMEGIRDAAEEGEALPAWIVWAAGHTSEVSALMLFAGLLAVLLCAAAASACERRRLA